MKRSKRIYVLLGVLGAACAATFGVMRYEEHKEKIKNSEEIILEIPKDSVKNLSWETESESFSFRKDESWIYEADEAFPADEETIDGMLEMFESFGVSFVIEEVEDYSQYGLDEPVCTVHLDAGEESYEITVGNYSNMDSERYVSIGDGNVYLVKEDPMDRFDVKLHDLIHQDETPYFETVASVQFAGTENYTITYEEDSDDTYCEEDVYFTENEDGKKPLDTYLVDRYLNSISSLDLTDYVTYNASEEELSSFGMDAPELTVTVEYSYENEDEEETDGTLVLNVSRDPKERKDQKEDSEEDEEITAYARVGESQIVYQISGSDYQELMACAYDDLRHQEVLTADFKDITQLDISLEGAVYTITAKEKDGEPVWYYQEEEVESSAIKTALASLKAESFTEEQPTEKEEISLTVSLDNEKYPQISIELYRYDGDTCLAVVDGEPVSLVKRSETVDLIEAVHEIVLKKTS